MAHHVVCCAEPDAVDQDKEFEASMLVQTRADAPLPASVGNYTSVPDVVPSEVSARSRIEREFGRTHSVQPSRRHWRTEAGQGELDWMNKMIAVMWPYAREVIRRKAKTEMLERMSMEVRKRPEIHMEDLDVEYDPGEAPPIVKAVRTHKKVNTDPYFESFQMDLDIEWCSKAFLMKPTIKGYGPGGIPIDSKNIAMEGIEMQGTVSIVLGPLIEKEPCFAAQQIFFFDPPDLKLTMTGLSSLGPIGRMLITAIKKTTCSIMADTMVLPHRVMVKARKDVPLETLIAVKSPLPIGVLEIEVLEAKDLPASDGHFSGRSSDPFVEISIGDCKMRTSTIAGTICPKWHDGPDYLLVYGLEQKMRIEVLDDDRLTDDDLLSYLRGYNAYHLACALEENPTGVWLDLINASDPSKPGGQLRLRGRLLDIGDLAEIADEAEPSRVRPSVVSSGHHKKLEHTDTYPSPPRVVSVKLLGMEGEQTKWFQGARATVTWIPDNLDKHEHAEKAHKPGLLTRGSMTLQAGYEHVCQTASKMKNATGLGYGLQERGIPREFKSGKAAIWGEKISKRHGVSDSSLSAVVVRAIEQLHHREGWPLTRVAAMFGISDEDVRAAAALRANFEVVWHQAMNFIQPAETRPFSGKVRIDVYVPVVQVNYAASQMSSTRIGGKKQDIYATVAKNGLVGAIQLDLSHQVLGNDKPWVRRVRARLRREGLGEHEDTEFQEGEGQCDRDIGDIVPGVLIEFIVEIRKLVPASAESHLEHGQHMLPLSELQRLSVQKSGVEIVSK